MAIGLLVAAFDQRSTSLGLFQRQLDLSEQRTYLTESGSTIARAQLGFHRGITDQDPEALFLASDRLTSALSHIRDGADHDARRLNLANRDAWSGLTQVLERVADETWRLADHLEKGSTARPEVIDHIQAQLNDVYRQCRKLSVELEVTVAEATHRIRSQLETTLCFLMILATLVSLLFLVLRGYIQRMLRTEARLSHARYAAEQANRAKSQFLAAMSHEIRTPMNGVVGTASVLRETSLDDQQRDYVDTIVDSGEHLLGLLDDILDFSKMDARKLELAPQAIDLHRLVNGAIRVLESHDKKTDEIGLELEIGPDVPNFVVADSKRLTQVLLNLLGNAIKFTNHGKVSLGVHVTMHEEDLAHVEFAVKDTGIGIPPERLQMIFDEFSQADRSINRQFGGTGLGLAISKRLVELMRGELTASSTTGMGSTFRFVIPLKPTQAPHQSGAKLRAIGPDSAALKVLVVDDNRVNRVLGGNILRKLGFEPAFAENGQEALDCCTAEAFDLVFMDMQMPVMDGIEATRLIRQRVTPHPYIVALTANVLPEHQTVCQAAGMNDFLTKPLKLDKMREFMELFTTPTSTS